MIELRISATNGLFTGVTQIYTSWESLKEFANRLRGFPRTTSDSVEDVNGEIGGYSYLRLVFRCISGAGHPIADIEMEQNQAGAGPGDLRGRVKLGFRIDGTMVDTFVAQQLARQYYKVMRHNNRLEKDFRPARDARRSRPLSLCVRPLSVDDGNLRGDRYGQRSDSPELGVCRWSFS